MKILSLIFYFLILQSFNTQDLVKILIKLTFFIFFFYYYEKDQGLLLHCPLTDDLQNTVQGGLPMEYSYNFVPNIGKDRKNRNNALEFQHSSSYLTIPIHLISGVRDFSFTFWLYCNPCIPDAILL